MARKLDIELNQRSFAIMVFVLALALIVFGLIWPIFSRL
jgi:hypothetical protein